MFCPVNPRPLISILLLVLVSTAARADVDVSAGIEHFRWTEDTEPEIEERGPRATLGLAWTQSGASPLRLGYEGIAYGGYVRYRGGLLFEPGATTSATTSYLGTAHEAVLRVRVNGAFDIKSSFGFDLWLRRLSSTQREDFTVVFARLGADVSPAPRRWRFTAGLKFPISVDEDAHLDLLGFDDNPRLEPRGKVTGYGQVAYRFDSPWSVLGYVDGFRFDASQRVTLTNEDDEEVEIFQPPAKLRTLGIRVLWHF